MADLISQGMQGYNPNLRQNASWTSANGLTTTGTMNPYGLTQNDPSIGYTGAQQQQQPQQPQQPQAQPQLTQAQQMAQLAATGPVTGQAQMQGQYVQPGSYASYQGQAPTTPQPIPGQAASQGGYQGNSGVGGSVNSGAGAVGNSGAMPQRPLYGRQQNQLRYANPQIDPTQSPANAPQIQPSPYRQPFQGSGNGFGTQPQPLGFGPQSRLGNRATPVNQ